MPKNDYADELYSSDEGQGELEGNYKAGKKKYEEHLAKGTSGRKDNYEANYVLSEISNRLLYSEKVTKIYDTVKDPLELERQRLEESIKVNTLANLGIGQAFDKCKDISECKDVLVKYGVKEGIDEKNPTEEEIVKEYKKRILAITEYHQQSEVITKTLDNQNLDTIEKCQQAISDIPNIGNTEKINHSSKKEDIIIQLKLVIYKESAIEQLRTHLGYETKAKNAEEGLGKVEALQARRNELAKDFKAAFPFIPRMPSAGIIGEWEKSGLSGGKNKVEIVRNLAEYRYQLHLDGDKFKKNHLGEFTKLCNLFKVDSNKQRAPNKLLEEIEKEIGRYPERHEITEYMRLTNQQTIKMTTVESSIHTKVQEKFGKYYQYIEDKYSLTYIGENGKNRTYRDLLQAQQEAIEKLDTPDSKNLEANKINFLAQVRANRKYNRIAYKDAVTANNSKRRFNLPPGRNTTNTFNTSGAMVQLVGPLSTYADITGKYKEDLSDYKETITQDQAREGTIDELRNLAQVEAMRSPSALLTNAMYFDLVVEGKLTIADLPTKMPMAMQGAVAESTSLEHYLREDLSSRVTYDYREGKQSSKTQLVTRNQNILHQWLVDTKLEDNIPITAINEAIKADDATIKSLNAKLLQGCTVKYFNQKDKEILKTTKDYESTKIADISRIEIKHKGYSIELTPQTIIMADQWLEEMVLFGGKDKVDVIKTGIKGRTPPNNRTVYDFDDKARGIPEGVKVQYFDKDNNEIKGEAKKTAKINNVHKITYRNEQDGKTVTLNVKQIDALKADITQDFESDNPEFLKAHSNLLGITIKEFPPAVFNELTKEWYGVELPYLEKDQPLSIGNLKQQKIENSHLKRTEKQIGQAYDIREAFATANTDKAVLLDKISNAAVITADIDLKAVDVKESVALDKVGKVEFLAEEDHIKDHAQNTESLIKRIESTDESGKIEKDTVIAIERKSYGQNLGVPDVIMLANVIEHNEKNPDNQLKIPEEITKDSLIYQDAVLYNTAKKHGVKVIGLEGKNLEAGKDSPQEYNKARENYMASRINQFTDKGYNVIAYVGSAHVDNLKRATENKSQDKSTIGVSEDLKQGAINIGKRASSYVTGKPTHGNSFLTLPAAKKPVKSASFGRK